MYTLKRRDFLKSAGAVAAGGVFVLSGGKARAESPKPSRPNILFIMSDDHCERAMGVYGSRLAGLDPTPNLDRFAKKGMVFDPFRIYQ